MKKISLVLVPAGLLLVLFLQGCSSSGSPIIEINTERLIGRQNMLNEVSRMLGDLGYEHILLQSPIRDKQEPVIDMYGEHRMLYRHPGGPDIRLDVRIRIADGVTVFRFQEQGRNQLSPGAARYFNQLEQQIDQQFGRDNMRVFHRELAAPF